MREEELNHLLKRLETISIEVDKYRQEIQAFKNEITRLRNSSQSSDFALNKPTPPPATTSVPGIENFIGLKLIHFVGIVVLIIGLTIGVKYAIDINLVTPFIRIALTYLAAIILFAISLMLRKKYELFSMILFSGSIASAYFTTYAAFEYYALLPRAWAFAIMLLCTAFTIYHSLKYKRQEIAIFGMVGAYGIPFFVRGNHDNLLMLFSYIFVINTGVLIISFKRYWIALNYVAFFTTWLIFLSTLIMREKNLAFHTGMVFCFLFYFLFLLNCVVFKMVKRQGLTVSDTFIVIVNTLFLYFSLQMLDYYAGGRRHGAENITLIFGIAYLLAAVIVKVLSPLQKHLYHALFAISLIALVTFVALKFSGLNVTIIWVVMAVLMFVAGVIAKEKFFRVAAILLFSCTLAKLIMIDSLDFKPGEKIIAYILTGTVLLVVSFLYQKFKQSIFGEG